MMDRPGRPTDSSAGRPPRRRLEPDVQSASMSPRPPPMALVRARATHPCRGAGRDEGRCMVYIPDGRILCHYCTRTVAAGSDGIICPLCGGILNEPNHFDTSRHFIRVHDRTTMNAIASRSR